MTKLRHVTFHPDDPWIPYADLLALPLGQRVKFVRTSLGLSQDEFAGAVGSSSGRHAVIRWEKGGEPRDFAVAIAGLTPYPPEAFRLNEGGRVSLGTLDLRLRAIEARLDELPSQEDVESGFETLREAIDRLATVRTRGAGRGSTG